MSGLDIQYIADLVLQAQEGDSNAFAELFAATHQKQYAFAHSYLRDDFLAQQALQRAYIQALQQITRLREPALFAVWLNQLTLQACFDLQITAPAQQNSTDPLRMENRMISIDGHACSVRQVLTLPFSEAQTILLSRLCSMRAGAIASLLEIPKRDVRRYIASGSARIRALSASEGGDSA